jgi:threonine synthase
MGLGIDKLIIATNANDILRRTLDTGRYEITGVEETASPSMDIQISSNFERLVFEALGRDAEQLTRLMQSLGQSGAFTLPEKARAAIRAEFDAGTTSEAETAATIAGTLKASGYLLDPHTAVAVNIARQKIVPGTPMISLSTAHPAKFPAAVQAASGVAPALPLWLADLFDRPERVSVLGNDQGAIEAFISARTRA